MSAFCFKDFGMDKKCYCCKNEAAFSIILCIEGNRIYIPNQTVREMINDMGDDTPYPIEEVSFCPDCMRKIEDNLRATILYLSSEK